MEKFCSARQATGDNVMRHREDVICMHDN